MPAVKTTGSTGTYVLVGVLSAIVAAAAMWAKPNNNPGLVFPIGIKVTQGPGFLHFDWPVDPQPPAPTPPTPVPTPTPVPVPVPPAPPDPTPPPQPPPVPVPVPVPVTVGRLHATLILDRATYTQDHAILRNLFTDGSLDQFYDTTARAYFCDQVDVKRLGFDAYAKTLPCVIFQESRPGLDSSPVISVLIPDGIPSVTKEIQRLRGLK